MTTIRLLITTFAYSLALLATGAPPRDGVDFFVVDVRYAELTETQSKSVDDLERDRAAGKLTPEQAARRAQAIQRNRALYLLGYIGTEARAVQVRRSDADAAKWTPESFPACIHFERNAPPKREERVWDTDASLLSRQGWKVVDRACDPSLKYRQHPWLDPKRFKSVSPTLQGEVKGVRFLAGFTNQAKTPFGSFTTDTVPDRWIITAVVTNPESDAIRGCFTVQSSDGADYGMIELSVPLAPARPALIEVVVLSKPAPPKLLSLKCIAAIAERTALPADTSDSR
jgi:hypothetical protein